MVQDIIGHQDIYQIKTLQPKVTLTLTIVITLTFVLCNIKPSNLDCEFETQKTNYLLKLYII